MIMANRRFTDARFRIGQLHVRRTRCPGSVWSIPSQRAKCSGLCDKYAISISTWLWNHSSFPKEFKCIPPSFLRLALLREPSLVSQPTKAQVAIKCEPVTVAVELARIPYAGAFCARCFEQVFAFANKITRKTSLGGVGRWSDSFHWPGNERVSGSSFAGDSHSEKGALKRNCKHDRKSLS